METETDTKRPSLSKIAKCIFLIIEAFILLVGVYVLTLKKSTNQSIINTLNSLTTHMNINEIKRVVLVRAKVNSKIPYVDDKYEVYDLNEDNNFVLNKNIFAHPEDVYYDLQKQDFVERPMENLLQIKRVNDQHLDYGEVIKNSEISEFDPFYFKLRLGQYTDSDYIISMKQPCAGNGGKRLPLTRAEYNKSLKIPTIGIGQDLLLAGYKFCNDNSRYTIQTCPEKQFYSLKKSRCVEFDPNNTPNLTSEEEIQKFIKEN